ncbi:MAG: leucine-rich repeat domain-containing protein [Candidatus Paceibacterota bacterium]|jgi:Leucine-rich repeat (LRR) protein
MDITATTATTELPVIDEDYNDDEVMASLWETWKTSFRESRGWTRLDQWVISLQEQQGVTMSSPSHWHVINLHLHQCRLKSPLPAHIGQLAFLQSLSLAGNALTSLPPEIGRLSSLKWLCLEHNHLESLPPEVGQLSSLKLLLLDYNHLTSLPPEMGHLSSSLKELGLSYNRLTCLPPEMRHLSSLQSLNLSHNQLASLLPEIGDLSSLEGLYLYHNRLKRLPPDIGRLSSLEVLNVSNNQLTSLPPEMAHLSSLQYLTLSSNQLVSLPSFLYTDAAKKMFPFLLAMRLNDNCLITPPPPFVSFPVEIGAQRLPATLDARYSFDGDIFDSELSSISISNTSPSSSSSSSSPFTLHFYIDGDDSDEGGGSEAKPLLSSSSIRIADRHRLARRWPYFHRLLEAGLSEAHSGRADLSRYFSLRLGQCLVDYFDGKPIQVSPLQTQDCCDLVEHADNFGLSDTPLHAFCVTKLRRGS